MGIVHMFGLLCLLASTILMIFVSVSVPVWKDVYFLKATLPNGGGLLKLGNWGACVGAQCTKSKLGYNLTNILSQGGSSRVSSDVVNGLTHALVLNPIAAAVSLIGLLFALGRNFALGLIASLWAFLAFVVTVVALGIDLGVFVTARHRLNNINGVKAELGNATWLVVAALILQFLAAITVCFTHASDRKARRNVHSDTTPVMAQTTTGVPRRHFWQRAPRETVY